VTHCSGCWGRRRSVSIAQSICLVEPEIILVPRRNVFKRSSICCEGQKWSFHVFSRRFMASLMVRVDEYPTVEIDCNTVWSYRRMAPNCWQVAMWHLSWQAIVKWFSLVLEPHLIFFSPWSYMKCTQALCFKEEKTRCQSHLLTDVCCLLILLWPLSCRCGGTVGAIFTCPLEVIKTRLQSSRLALRTVYYPQVHLGTISGAGMVRPTSVTPGLLQVLK
jgi:hypothetical protein